MTRAPQGAAAQSVQDAAMEWFLRRDMALLSKADAAAFEAWLAEAPEHEETYAAVETLWAATAQLESHPRFEEKRRAVLGSVDRGRLTRRAMAAGFAVAVGLAGTGLYSLSGPKPLATQSFRTAVGQQATVTLPDGSVLTLNTDTTVRTRADRDRRLVYLDKGQAFFRVAKDRRHPFVVAAAGRTVTAIGTAFDVRVDRGALKVVLVEGKVRVESAKPAPTAVKGVSERPQDETPGSQATEMSAGSQLVASADTGWRLTRTNVTRETSWLHGQIVFDDEALGDIAAELNRYSTRKIVIADAALAQKRLSGIYTPGDVHGFSRALKATGLAEVEEESDGEVRIVALK
jgi:transmembrane sensor